MGIFTYSADQALNSVDNMNGRSFEYWCAGLLRNNGFRSISVTKGSGDQGVDIIAYKGNVKHAIQCKCYKKDLGNRPVQEVISGMEYYDCSVGIVMTNQYFTKGAIDLAQKANILLWDRDVLKNMIYNGNKSSSYPKYISNRKKPTNKSKLFPHDPDSPYIDADYYRELPHIEHPEDSKSFVKATCNSDISIMRVTDLNEIITLTSEPFDTVEEAEHFAKVIEKHCCGITRVDGMRVIGRFHVCSVAANWDEKTNEFTFANWA